MLYFDDFMEAIESLPSELSENLTTVKHLDHQAQNCMDTLGARVTTFFENCNHMRLSENDQEFEYRKIIGEYDKAMDYSKRKLDVVNNIHDTYQKLMRKLDSELGKFRLELEADNSGVTSKIEHRIRTLLGRNIPLTNRLDKRRSKYRAGHLFNSNRVISRRRPVYGHDAPERQFIVLKRRFAAFDTSPVPLPLDSAYNSNGGNFLPEESSGAIISDSAGRLIGSEGIRRIPSTESLDSIGQHMPDNDFTTFQADFCGDDDDIQLAVDSSKRIRTLGTPQRSATAPADINGRDNHRSHHGGNSTSCYSPIIANSDNEAGAAMAASDQSIDDLIANPASSSASPSIKRGESPRWFGGTSSTRRMSSVSVTSRNPGPLRRPSRIGASTLESIDDGSVYLSSNELHYRYSPARSIKDHHGRHETFPMLGAGGIGDLDEQRYCFCQDVSYGDMIGCDGIGCPYEWFHYGCVGLMVAPRGSWHCPDCVKNGRHLLGRKRSTHRR